MTKEQELKLKHRFGKAIERIPGKSKEVLLLEFEDNCRLWLRGKNTEPTAYIEAAIFGNESHTGYPAFTASVAEIFHDVLGILPENLYIKYEDISAWSVGSQYIDRKMFR